MNKENSSKPKTKNKEKKSHHGKKDFLVVGLGASAGGVKALQEFFATMPPNSGMAFVAILHLSPEHESNLAQIIQAKTQMKVTQVTETVKVEPNNVYVIPPNQQLEMVDGVIRPAAAERPMGHRIAIDVFFRTLADAYEKNAVCVVLSGTGSDGTLGLKRVKESNGFAIVQDPDDAEYDSMPRSAINTQLADWVLPVNQMPEKLIHFRESSERLHLTNGADAEKVGEEINADESLREILTLLRVRTGHDFANYKTPTLIRRIARHLQIHELEDIPSYLELLRNNPNEIHSLLKNLLINVTNFFRDKEAFQALEAEVIPNLFAGKTGKDTVRVWSCGCASGEEAYSLAMLLGEYADRLADPPKFQIFASDVDDEAIAEAREHRYPEAIETDVSAERLKRFFVKEDSFYRIKKEVRETVLFAPHNVLRDPPFSRLDLISCRNLLIYLNRDTQERVLQIFHFALASAGYLFLGSSESAEGVATLFAPVDKKQRIYSRRLAPVAQNTLPIMPVAGRWEVRLPERKTDAARERAATLSDIHYKLLENYAPSSVLVNQDFDIVYLSGTAGRFLRFASGEPSRNLLKAINPDLLPDLRAALFTAQREHKSSEFPNIRLNLNGEETIINLIVRAVDVEDEASDFLLVIFEERISSSALKAADAEIDQIHSKDEAMETVVRRLEEDLQRTKEHLRFTIEQHETTVEELKASNEELQAINEELRSASEELETSKEELQSVNEELTTVNHELKDKIDETVRVNSDLSNLMAATDIATIFLDKNLCIKRYTPPVERIFNITPKDFGRPLEHFTHHLRYDNLAADAEKALRSLVSIEREITDDKNRAYLARFAPYRTIDDRIDGVVLNFIDITDRRDAEEAVRLSEERLQKAIGIETVGVIFFNNEFEIIDCNDAFAQMSGYTRRELKAGKFSWQKFTPDGFVEVSSRALVELNTVGIATPYEKEYVRKDGTRFWALFAAKRIGKNEIVEFVTDITEQKLAQAAVRESEEKYRTLFDSIDEAVTTLEVIFDKNDKVVDWVIVETNPAMTRVNGWISSEVVGRKISEILPNVETFWLDTVERVVKTGEPIRVEHPVEGLNDNWFESYIARVGGEGSRQVVCVYNNITARKRTEANLAFLAEVSQDLAGLTNIDETMNRLGAKIGAHFNVAFCAFSEMDEQQETTRIEREWKLADLPSWKGVHRIGDFHTEYFREASRAGEISVVRDTATDARVNAAQMAALAAGSFVNLPLVRTGKWQFNLTVADTAPRDWQADEIELLREIADRIWARLERARAEEALTASEEKFRAIFNQAVSGIAETDLTGKFMRANSRYCQMTGYSYEELLAMRMQDITHPDDLAREMEKFERLVDKGEPFDIEKRYIRRDGTPIWVHNSVAAINGADGNPQTVVAVSVDITTRKHAEELLRESEERLRIATEAAEMYSWEFDAESETYKFSENAHQILGIARENLPLKIEDAFTLVHPDDLELLEKTLRQALDSGKGFAVDFRSQTEAGETIWLGVQATVVKNEAGKVARVIGTAQNITDRRRAEEAVRQSEERLQLILQSITDYAVITTDPQGIINGWNTGAENTFGWTAREATGKPCAILFTPEDQKAGIPKKEMDIARNEGIAEDHRWHIRKDGTRFFASGTIAPITNGEFDGFVKITSDQTERMNAEKLSQEKETLRRIVAGQEDERRRIARDIHDHFGQQLTVLRLKLEDIRKKSRSEKLLTDVDAAQNVAANLDSDVDFIAWELRPAALDDLGLRATLENFVQQWSHHTKVRAEFHTAGIGKKNLAFETETNLYRIAQEALNNIYKHAEAKNVSVILEKRKNEIVLIIEDDGIGFDVEDKDNSKKGIGLVGMQERARILGGDLEIESEKDAGTTIFARVPAKFGGNDREN